MSKDVIAGNTPANGKKFLFVYGTLKRNYGNNAHYLGKSTFIKAAALEGFRMFAHGKAFPGIFKTDGMYYRVYGEIFEVDDITMAATDRLEGVAGGFYRREEATTATGERVYVYVQDEPSHPYDSVVGGEWRGHETSTYKSHHNGSSYSYTPPPATPAVKTLEPVYEAGAMARALPNVVWENNENAPETVYTAGP